MYNIVLDLDLKIRSKTSINQNFTAKLLSNSEFKRILSKNCKGMITPIYVIHQHHSVTKKIHSIAHLEKKNKKNKKILIFRQHNINGI